MSTAVINTPQNQSRDNRITRLGGITSATGTAARSLLKPHCRIQPAPSLTWYSTRGTAQPRSSQDTHHSKSAPAETSPHRSGSGDYGQSPLVYRYRALHGKLAV